MKIREERRGKHRENTTLVLIPEANAEKQVMRRELS